MSIMSNELSDAEWELRVRNAAAKHGKSFSDAEIKMLAMHCKRREVVLNSEWFDEVMRTRRQGK